MPAAMHFSRSPAMALAVTATMGVWVNRAPGGVKPPCSSARISCVASSPLSSGICTSIMIRSTPPRFQAATASRPLRATTVLQPSFFSNSRINSSLTGWSSATSTWVPLKVWARDARCSSSMGALKGATSRGRVDSACRGSVNPNALPLPGSLVKRMCPPISVTNRDEMANPNPVPPYLRVVDASACVKASKMRVCCSADMPMPVSRTSKLMPPFGAGLTMTPTWPPRGVNLTALDNRLTSTWRSLTGSPTTDSGSCGSMSTSMVNSFTDA